MARIIILFLVSHCFQLSGQSSTLVYKSNSKERQIFYSCDKMETSLFVILNNKDSVDNVLSDFTHIDMPSYIQFLYDVFSSMDTINSNGVIRYNPIWLDSLEIIRDLIIEDSKLLTTILNRMYVTENLDAYAMGFRGSSLKLIEIKTYSIEKVNVLIFNHGLVVQKNGKYSWCFINDGLFLECRLKLRWDAIESVKLVDEYEIAVTVSGGITSQNCNYLINYQKGIIRQVF